MAEIRPLRAWRYNQELSAQIESLTSPLFDVVSEKQRLALYRNPFNSIHLSVPLGPNPAEKAKALLEKWKGDGTILQDALPGIYVYYQYFKIPGSSREYCRKGFICHIRTYDWSDRILLRHENTIPKSVNDRIALLEKTELHVSPTHGLYTDDTFALEGYMDDAIAHPIFETEDYQGVRDVLAVIHDVNMIARFMAVMKEKQVILADGHHRYEGSLVHKHRCQETSLHHTGQEGYNYHLMYLTNTEDGDLTILPTHRLVKSIPGFDEDSIVKKLEVDFIVKPLDDPDTVNEIILGKKWAFGILFRDKAYKVRLKPESFPHMTWHFPEEIKALDLTVLHYFIIEKILGIPGRDQRKTEHVDFD